jgi:hypothetical protein
MSTNYQGLVEPSQHGEKECNLLSETSSEARWFNSKSSCWRYPMSPTLAECMEHARQCEWYAAHTKNEEDRTFLLRKAKDWTKLVCEKELEIRASARMAA